MLLRQRIVVFGQQPAIQSAFFLLDPGVTEIVEYACVNTSPAESSRRNSARLYVANESVDARRVNRPLAAVLPQYNGSG
jgi:hypothetical protein